VSLPLKADSLRFTALSSQDIPCITSNFAKIGWNKPSSIYEGYLLEQEKGQRHVWLAFSQQTFLGYVTLKWQSDYLAFRQQDIPEIADLNVLPAFRRQGVGSKLLSLAENEAYKKSLYVGLGVGLYADYGAAQKNYVKRGYVPDGQGLTYNNAFVSPGTSVRVDDNLALWLIKEAEQGCKPD
jgi:GNAT superfamily N-acetyltransferase